MAFNRSSLFAIVALLMTLWAVIATSDGRGGSLTGSYFVSSDCVTPVREGQVQVLNDQIIGGAATSYIDFGFPTAIVTRSADSIGFISGVNRVCTPSYVDPKEDNYVYSCSDNGSPTCTITIN